MNNHATRNLVAYIPEIVNLYPTLTGLENLAFFSAIVGQGSVIDKQFYFC